MVGYMLKGPIQFEVKWGIVGGTISSLIQSWQIYNIQIKTNFNTVIDIQCNINFYKIFNNEYKNLCLWWVCEENHFGTLQTAGPDTKLETEQTFHSFNPLMHENKNKIYSTYFNT